MSGTVRRKNSTNDDLNDSGAAQANLLYFENSPCIHLDIHTACSSGDYDFVRQLIDHRVNLNAVNKSGWTPLMYAAYLGRDTVVNLLLDAIDLDVNKAGTDGTTPLMKAAANAHESIVYFLTQHGAAINITDNKGRTALFHAARKGNQAILKMLLDGGANIEHREYLFQFTPLMFAAKKGTEVAVQALLDRGAKVDATNSSGETAMSLASKYSKNSVILTLLERAKNNLTTVSEDDLRSEAGLLTSMKKSPNDSISLQTPNIRAGPEAIMKLSPIPTPGALLLPTKDEVEEFLEMLGLIKYLPLFRQEDIDFDTLLTMNENDLKSIGLTAFGPRRKIFTAIQGLLKEEVEATVRRVAPSSSSSSSLQSLQQQVPQRTTMTTKIAELTESLNQSQARLVQLERELELERSARQRQSNDDSIIFPVTGMKL